MMLNINGDGLNTPYDELLGYNPANNKNATKKPSSSKQSNPQYAQNSKKKSNSAQPSPHRNGVKSTKNQSYSNAICVGLPSLGMNESRPYSAKNSSYNKKKTGALIKMLK